MTYLEIARRYAAQHARAREAHERNEQNEQSLPAVVRVAGAVPAEPTKETDEADSAGRAGGLRSFPSFLSSPEGPGDGSGDAPPDDGPAVARTVATAVALDDDERTAWQQEIVAAIRWAEAGHAPDPHLEHDLAALRRLVPYGVCLACGSSCPADGQHWCAGCRARGTQERGAAQ